ncbi:MAG: ABC transporter substrate-binding protein [Dehalococcoidia bacterium]|nr:ABC transporter substrate-binding protein [Dehalococcoidia bacterium]
MKRLFNILLAAVTLLLILPACSGGTQLHPVRGEFIEGQLGETAQTLNWIVATDGGASRRFAGFMVDPLAVYDSDFNIHLRCLASDIEVAADGLTYTASIRNDLKWTDGTEVTADDYVFTINNLLAADWLAYEDVTKWQETVDSNSVFVTAEAVDATAFKVVRKTVDPDFLYALYQLMPYPKHIAVHYENKIEAFTQAPEFANLNYSGNMGPYKPIAWSATDGFVMRRNPDYYLGKETGAPYFEKYTIKQYGLQSMMAEALDAGKASYGYVEPQEATALRNKGDVNVYPIPTGYYVYLGYNQRDNCWEGLKDVRVRQAISMMINKPAIVQDMYMGYAQAATSFIPSYSPWYDDSIVKDYGMNPGRDQQTAIDLIKSAGFEQKEIDGEMKFIDEDGDPIKLNFLIDIDSDFEQNLAILIRKCLLNIGLDVNPKFSTREIIFMDGLMNRVPDSDQTPAFNNGPGAVSGQPWDLVILSSHANPLAMEGSSEFFTTTGKFNLFGYFDARVDELYKRANSVEGINPESRKQIYSELVQVITDAQPVDFLVFYKDNYVFSKNLKGVEPGINVLYNYQFWYFE